MKKRKFNKWLCIPIFIIGMALLTWGLSGFLKVSKAKDVLASYGFHKEPENSLDVVLIGSSSIYTSFYCPLAYEKYGFTSYTLTSSSMRASLYKTAIQVSEACQSPDLYVIEINGFTYKDQHQEVALRKFLDSIPDSEIRDQAIEEIVPEELKESFYKPFLKYHSNWKRLGSCSLVLIDKIAISLRGYSVGKGFCTETTYIPDFAPTNTLKMTKQGREELTRLLDFLKSEHIDNVLFVRMPEMIRYEEKDSFKELIQTLQDNGYDYLDLDAQKEAMGIDMNHDFYNSNHMNIYGAEKNTLFLGNYINTHYELSKDHTEKVRKEWDFCADQNERVINNFKKKTEWRHNIQRFCEWDF